MSPLPGGIAAGCGGVDVHLDQGVLVGRVPGGAHVDPREGEVDAGDHVVAARALFGSCIYVLEILGRFGVEVTLVDGTDLDQWRAAVREGTKVVFLESVSNPTLEVIDLAYVCDLAHENGALVVVDDAMATNPVTVPSDTPIGHVVKTMADQNIGAVLVVDEDRLEGIFTDVDAVKLLARLLGEL